MRCGRSTSSALRVPPSAHPPPNQLSGLPARPSSGTPPPNNPPDSRGTVALQDCDHGLPRILRQDTLQGATARRQLRRLPRATRPSPRTTHHAIRLTTAMQLPQGVLLRQAGMAEPMGGALNANRARVACTRARSVTTQDSVSEKTVRIHQTVGSEDDTGLGIDVASERFRKLPEPVKGLSDEAKTPLSSNSGKSPNAMPASSP